MLKSFILILAVAFCIQTLCPNETQTTTSKTPAPRSPLVSPSPLTIRIPAEVFAKALSSLEITMPDPRRS